MNVLDIASDYVAGVHIAHRRIFPARHDHRQIFLHRGVHPRILYIDLVILLQRTAFQHLIHKFVREIMLARRVGLCPDIDHRLFQPAHCLMFRNARVRHAVHMPVEQFLLILRRQIAIIRHAFVEIMRDEIEKIFLQIRSRTRNDLHLVLPNHLRQAQPQLRRRHCTRQRDHHLVAHRDMRLIAFRRVNQRRRIEMPIVMFYKFCDLSVHNTSLMLYRCDLVV